MNRMLDLSMPTRFQIALGDSFARLGPNQENKFWYTNTLRELETQQYLLEPPKDDITTLSSLVTVLAERGPYLRSQ